MDAKQKDEFTRAVYDLVMLVPPGRATSYGAIAAGIGHANLSRMVGRAMSGCPEGIPAHRVVNSQGVLTAAGCFSKPGRMQALLEAEGVEVASNRIRNWRRVFWDPVKEL